MAIEPGIYNFTLQRRSDHTIPLIFKDGNNNAINLTGFTVAAQVWDQTRTTKYADFGVTYTCLLYTSPSPRDVEECRMPSSA